MSTSYLPTLLTAAKTLCPGASARRRLTVQQGDPLPITVVAPGGDLIGGYAMNRSRERVYSVLVARFVGSGLRADETTLASVQDARETLVSALGSLAGWKAAGATGLYDVEVMLKPEYDDAAASAGYDAAVVEVRLYTMEAY